MNIQTQKTVRGTPMWTHRTAVRGAGTPCRSAYGSAAKPFDSSLAMVYSPYQSFTDIYDPTAALGKGTIFAELNKPFCPCGAAKNTGV